MIVTIRTENFVVKVVVAFRVPLGATPDSVLAGGAAENGW